MTAENVCPGCERHLKDDIRAVSVGSHAPGCLWIVVCARVMIQFMDAVGDGGLINASKVRKNANDLWDQGVRPVANLGVDMDKLWATALEEEDNFPEVVVKAAYDVGAYAAKKMNERMEELIVASAIDVTLLLGPFDGHRMKIPEKTAQLWMMRDLKNQPILATALERAQNVTYYYTRSKHKPSLFVYGGPIKGEDM